MAQMSSLSGELLSREIRSTESTRLFTTQRRQDAILAGEREFARLTGVLVRQTTFSCSNGVAEYDVLSTVTVAGGDFMRPAPQGPEYHLISSGASSAASTTITAGLNFQRRDVEWLNQYEPSWKDSTGTAAPTAHYYRADGGRHYFGINPPPTIASSETGKVVFPYLAWPTGSTASTAEPFTVSSQVRTDLRPYHQGLVHHAAHTLEKLRGDDLASDRQLQKFVGYVTAFLQDRRPTRGQTLTVRRTYFREASRSRPDAVDPRRDWSH